MATSDTPSVPAKPVEVSATDGALTVRLRLPTSFCSPNFAYLMASDSKDALTALPWTRDVVVLLDDHHDSDLINRGLAADAGYRGTFGAEAEKDLEALRLTFRRKAHSAAMERALSLLLRENPDLAEEDLHGVVLGDLSTACEVFGLARRKDGLAAYEVRVCSESMDVESMHVALRVPWRLSSLSEFSRPAPTFPSTRSIPRNASRATASRVTRIRRASSARAASSAAIRPRPVTGPAAGESASTACCGAPLSTRSPSCRSFRPIPSAG